MSQTSPAATSSSPKALIDAMLRAGDLIDRADAEADATAARAMLRDADALFDRFLEGDGNERDVLDAYWLVESVAITLLFRGSADA